MYKAQLFYLAVVPWWNGTAPPPRYTNTDEPKAPAGRGALSEYMAAAACVTP